MRVVSKRNDKLLKCHFTVAELIYIKNAVEEYELSVSCAQEIEGVRTVIEGTKPSMGKIISYLRKADRC